MPPIHREDLVFLDACGVHARPYSPELNPIELLWHEFKDRMRAVRQRDTRTLDAAIKKALKELPRSIFKLGAETVDASACDTGNIGSPW